MGSPGSFSYIHFSYKKTCSSTAKKVLPVCLGKTTRRKSRTRKTRKRIAKFFPFVMPLFFDILFVFWDFLAISFYYTLIVFLILLLLFFLKFYFIFWIFFVPCFWCFTLFTGFSWYLYFLYTSCTSGYFWYLAFWFVIFDIRFPIFFSFLYCFMDSVLSHISF